MCVSRILLRENHFTRGVCRKPKQLKGDAGLGPAVTRFHWFFFPRRNANSFFYSSVPGQSSIRRVDVPWRKPSSSAARLLIVAVSARNDTTLLHRKFTINLQSVTLNADFLSVALVITLVRRPIRDTGIRHSFDFSERTEHRGYYFRSSIVDTGVATRINLIRPSVRHEQVCVFVFIIHKPSG